MLLSRDLIFFRKGTAHHLASPLKAHLDTESGMSLSGCGSSLLKATEAIFGGAWKTSGEIPSYDTDGQEGIRKYSCNVDFSSTRSLSVMPPVEPHRISGQQSPHDRCNRDPHSNWGEAPKCLFYSVPLDMGNTFRPMPLPFGSAWLLP